MQILISGSRNWKNYKAMYDVLKTLPKDTQIIHGGCRGADLMAGEIAKSLGFKESKVYPADWKKNGRGAGPKRNQLMLDENPEIVKVIAFHEDISKSKGTKDMIKRSRKAGKEVEIISG